MFKAGVFIVIMLNRVSRGIFALLSSLSDFDKVTKALPLQISPCHTTSATQRCNMSTLIAKEKTLECAKLNALLVKAKLLI